MSDEINEKVLTIAQRQKRAMIMRRHEQKIERAREVAQHRMASEKNIKKRAYVQARQIIRKRFAGERGAEYEKLGPSEKMAIDRAIEKKTKLIKKLALRLIPKVRQAEQKRLHTFIKGAALQNQGQPEGHVTEDTLNALFAERVEEIEVTKAEKNKDKNAKKVTNNIIMYSKFGEEAEQESAVYKAISKKATKSGIDLDILGEVYDRGMEAWSEDTGVSQQQYAFARVNSYINQGKTYFNEDADLHENAWNQLGQKKPVGNTLPAPTRGSVPKHGRKFSEGDHVVPHTGPYAGQVHRVTSSRAGSVNIVRPNTPKYDSITVRAKHEHLSPATPEQTAKYRADREADRKRMFGEDANLQEMGGDQHYSDTKGAFSKGAKGTPITSDKMKKDTSKALNQMFQKAMKKEEVKIEEGRAPGTPSIKRYTRNDGTTALKSLNKWGKRKDWRDTEGGLAKAREHAGVDKVTEEVEQVDESWINSPIKWKEAVRAKHGDVTFKRKNQPGVLNKSDTHATNSDGKVVGVYQHHNKMGRVYEEVQQTNENFMDGKGPGKPGDSARHGLKGKSASELRKIRSSETTSPRKKQLAHWLLNMHHNEETELDEKRGLWDNIHAKRKRIKAGSGERMRKPGSKGAPTAQDFKDASESYVNEEERPDPKVKVEGTNCRNCVYWRKDLEKPVTKEELNPNGGLKAPNKEYIAMSKRIDLGTLPGKDSGVKVKGFCDHDMIKDWVTERMCCSQWDSDGMIRDYKGQSPVMKEEGESILPQTTSKGSKIRKKIEVVDRKPPHGEFTRQAEIKHKIIDEEGNSQPDPKKRLIGTNSLVKAYKKDTPGQSLDESFNIAYAAGIGQTFTAADLGMRVQGGFALHPSVIAEMERRAAEEVEEEVKTADVKAEVVPAHTKTIVDPKSGALKQVTVPGHVRRAKKNKTIIASGSVTDGQPQ